MQSDQSIVGSGTEIHFIGWTNSAVCLIILALQLLYCEPVFCCIFNYLDFYSCKAGIADVICSWKWGKYIYK